MFIHIVIFIILLLSTGFASSEQPLPPIQETFAMETNLPLVRLFNEKRRLDCTRISESLPYTTIRQMCTNIIEIVSTLNPSNPIFKYKEATRILILERDFNRMRDILEFISSIDKQIDVLIDNYISFDEIDKQIELDLTRGHILSNSNELDKEFNNLSTILTKLTNPPTLKSLPKKSMQKPSGRFPNFALFLPPNQSLKIAYQHIFHTKEHSYITDILDDLPQFHVSEKYDAFAKNIYIKICQDFISAITIIRQQFSED